MMKQEEVQCNTNMWNPAQPQSKVIIPLDPASPLAIVRLTTAHQHSTDGAILMPLSKSVITHNTHHSHFGSIHDLGDMLWVSINEVSLVANDAYHSALLHPLLHKVTVGVAHFTVNALSIMNVTP